METMLEAEDRDGVAETTLREVAGLSPEVVEYMRTQPNWQARVDAAHTIPRELRRSNPIALILSGSRTSGRRR
jgi:hypothetical protein